MPVSSTSGSATATATGNGSNSPELAATASGFDGNLTVSQFAGNPSTAFQASGAFFDVNVTPQQGTTLDNAAAVTVQLQNLTAVAPLQWWNGKAWTPVTDASGLPVIADASGNATVTLTNATLPPINQLSGTWILAGKVVPVITWANPADITYGTALVASQLDATASVPGSFTYTPAAGTVLQTGTGRELSVSFTPTDTTDYTTAADTAAINVLRAVPVITWANPTNITYGTALVASQLDATASVPGSFTYTPAAGTVLKAGTGQTLSVSFAPTDSTDYTTATGAAAINVLQAVPVITWANPANITYGTAFRRPTRRHGQRAGQLHVHAGGRDGAEGRNRPDAFGELCADGQHRLHHGDGDRGDQRAPGSSRDHLGQSDEHHLRHGVGRRPTRRHGQRAGSFTYTPAAGTVLKAGTGQTLSVSFAPTDSTDYTTATARAAINVLRAVPVITWANPANITYGTALAPANSTPRPAYRAASRTRRRPGRC